MSTPRHTLVIHPGALGDVLHAVPALRALHRQRPVTFAGQLRIARLLQGVGLVDIPLSFDGLGLEALFTDDPVPRDLSSRFTALDGVVSWFGARDDTYAHRLRSIAPDAVIAPPVPSNDAEVTVWQHLLATVGPTSAPDIGPLELPRSWREDAERALVRLTVNPTRPLLVVHPGAGSAWKVWPLERLARVIARLVARQSGTQVLIHQGPADRDVADRLSRLLEVETHGLIEPELSQLAAVLARAAAYLGGDSGVSHLAAAVGAPSVILFPASTRRRWAPWGATAHLLTMTEEGDEATVVEEAVAARLGDWRAP